MVSNVSNIMVIEDHFSGTIKNVAVDLKTIFY